MRFNIQSTFLRHYMTMYMDSEKLLQEEKNKKENNQFLTARRLIHPYSS